MCEIKALVAPSGFDFAWKDAGYVDQRSETGFIVQTDFLAALEESNALLIPEGEYTLSLYNDVIKKAVDAAKMGRHILMCL